jgi:hypothetical protein
MKTTKRFAVGDKVRLTGDFLRSTGQFAGGDGMAVWTVQACPCSLCREGRFILTDELRQDDGVFTSADIRREPHLQFRHVNAANVQKAR